MRLGLFQLLRSSFSGVFVEWAMQRIPAQSIKNEFLLCRVLYLDSNNLKDLNEVVSQLTSLRSIDLSNNPLSPLPTGILSRLVYLNELRLYRLGLREFPRDFCCVMPHLRLIGLSHNSLSHLPPEMNRLRLLEELHLENNLFQEFPLSICTLPEMKVQYNETVWLLLTKILQSALFYLKTDFTIYSQIAIFQRVALETLLA